MFLDDLVLRHHLNRLHQFLEKVNSLILLLNIILHYHKHVFSLLDHLALILIVFIILWARRTPRYFDRRCRADHEDLHFLEILLKLHEPTAIENL